MNDLLNNYQNKLVAPMVGDKVVRWNSELALAFASGDRSVIPEDKVEKVVGLNPDWTLVTDKHLDEPIEAWQLMLVERAE